MGNRPFGDSGQQHGKSNLTKAARFTLYTATIIYLIYNGGALIGIIK